MEMETTDKNYYCCECIHYLHGQLEQPCEKSNPYVGYLNRGCDKWENDKGEKIPVKNTKVCKVCGQELPKKAFSVTKKTADKRMDVCKECNKKKKKRKEQ